MCTAADPGLGDGCGCSGCGRGVPLSLQLGGMGGGGGGGGAVSSPAGWGSASEALQLYYIPIMKGVKKSCFHRLCFALFNNNKTHMFTVLVYAW